MDLEKALKDLRPTTRMYIVFKILTEECSSAHFGKGEEEAVNEFLRLIKVTHPTHQQSFARFIQKIIKVYADKHKENDFDMRNEAACKLFAELHKISKENPLPFF
jgi:hypothetical protein